LKIGTLVRTSVLRMTFAVASGCPYQRDFALAHAQLMGAAAGRRSTNKRAVIFEHVNRRTGVAPIETRPGCRPSPQQLPRAFAADLAPALQLLKPL